MIMLPYSLKYLWSPVIDSFSSPFLPARLGQRKGWMLLMQISMLCLIPILGFLNPIKHLYAFVFVLLLIAIIAATFDIALEAYRIELFQDDKKRASATSYNIFGFRIGLILSGAVGISLSSFVQWKYVFCIISILIIPCMFVIYNSIDESKIDQKSYTSFRQWFSENCISPLLELKNRAHFYKIVLLIACYKLSDGFLDVMLLPFLIKIGYSKTQIASSVKLWGIIAAFIGTYMGALFIKRYNIIICLFVAECLAALTNLSFIALIDMPDNNLLILINFIENFCAGLCNMLLVCYMSSLCNKNFTATQYAILASISGFSRVILSSISGVTANFVGWEMFFIISALISLPSIFCLLRLYKAKN